MQLWTRVNTAAANPAHGLGGGSLTMGGCQRDISIYMNVTAVQPWTRCTARAPMVWQ